MFWDSSAVVPLLLPEAQSVALTSLLATDKEVTIWWSTPLECRSALYRRHRETPMDETRLSGAAERLRALVDHADTIAPTDDVRSRAARLVAVHPLRAADALQLAAALTWCEEHPHGEVVVSLDDRLRAAAQREGFILRPVRESNDPRLESGPPGS